MIKKYNSKNRGFTMVEVLVYISILAILLITIIMFIFWIIKSNTKVKVIREVLDNSERVMRIITDEIRDAESIYNPDLNPLQLSLKTLKYLPAGEDFSYIDFYDCGGRICLKKESEDPIILSSKDVTLNVLFEHFKTGGNSGVKIILTVSYNNPNPIKKPEYNASIELVSSVSLR